jgi:hypothetical protein
MLPIGIKLVGMTRYLPMPLSRILLQVLTAGVGPSRPSTVVRFRGLAANKQSVTPERPEPKRPVPGQSPFWRQ